MKKKKTPQIIPIRIPIYEQNIVVFYGSDFKQLRRWIKKDLRGKKKAEELEIYLKILNHLEEGQDRRTATYILQNGRRIIWLKESDNISELSGRLAHELTHLVYEFLKYLGLTLTEESEEAYAYLTGYLMERILEELV